MRVAWPIPGNDTKLTPEEAGKVWREYLIWCSYQNKVVMPLD
jgi:hypothetical protein